jgi:hypothetical protein
VLRAGPYSRIDCASGHRRNGPEGDAWLCRGGQAGHQRDPGSSGDKRQHSPPVVHRVPDVGGEASHGESREADLRARAALSAGHPGGLAQLPEVSDLGGGDLMALGYCYHQRVEAQVHTVIARLGTGRAASVVNGDRDVERTAVQMAEAVRCLGLVHGQADPWPLGG